MTDYIVPLSDDVLNLLCSMHGRILLDNSAATLPIGILNGKIVGYKKDFIEFSLDLMGNGCDYQFLMDNQQAYMDGLCGLANEKKLFTVDGIVRKEMLDLKYKSDKYAKSFIEPEFVAYFTDFSNGVEALLNALNGNVPNAAGDSFYSKIRRDMNHVRIKSRKPPSRVDKDVAATALYESHANSEEINTVAVDEHIHKLVDKYWRSKNRRRVDASVRCFAFDKKSSYELVPACSTLRK